MLRAVGTRVFWSKSVRGGRATVLGDRQHQSRCWIRTREISKRTQFPLLILEISVNEEGGRGWWKIHS